MEANAEWHNTRCKVFGGSVAPKPKWNTLGFTVTVHYPETLHWGYYNSPSQSAAQMVWTCTACLVLCSGWNCQPWPSRSQNWMFVYFIIVLSCSQQFPTSSKQNQVKLGEWATGHFMHCTVKSVTDLLIKRLAAPEGEKGLERCGPNVWRMIEYGLSGIDLQDRYANLPHKPFLPFGFCRCLRLSTLVCVSTLSLSAW